MQRTSVKEASGLQLGNTVKVEFIHEDKSLKGVRLTNRETGQSFLLTQQDYYGLKVFSEDTEDRAERHRLTGTLFGAPVDMLFEDERKLQDYLGNVSAKLDEQTVKALTKSRVSVRLDDAGRPVPGSERLVTGSEQPADYIPF